MIDTRQNNMDIFDKNIFEIRNFNPPEPSDVNNDLMCRWSEGRFTIIQKRDIKNVCILFKSAFSKPITVFISNQIKNTKFDFDLKSGNEYLLYIPISTNDNLSFFVEPTIPYQNGDSRKLGIYVRKIYTSTNEYDSIQLLDANVYSCNELHLETKSNDILEIPIKDQNNSVEIFNLEYTRTNLHYNSALFKFNDKKYLMTRKASFVLKNTQINTLNLFEFDTQNQIKLNINNEVEYEQYEDPRVFVYNDKIYVGCANYTHDYINYIHQKILVFDSSFNHIRNIHPVYGNNGSNIHANYTVEKNWTYFTYNNRLMCVYKMYPHTVVEFDWDGRMIAEYKSYFDTNKVWKFGECRGGSNPIYKDGYYHCFFHSSIHWDKWKRRYFMGYYKFKSEPPFDIVEMSEKPILWGNTSDIREYPETSPLVVFPCGSVIENEKFMVSFGLNDERTGIIKI